MKRLKGAGRKLNDTEFDEKMINWIREQRHKKFRVSRTTIQRKALDLSTDEEFKVKILFLLKSKPFRQAMDGWKVF